MKKGMLILGLAALCSCKSSAQLNLGKLEQEGKEAIKKAGGDKSSTPLTNEEVVKGLKEALQVGTNNSTASASQLDGFYKNPKITIPFPPEAQKVKEKALELGMKEQVDKFEINLNRAAEEASKQAAPIFIQAITSMSVSDGFSILKGADNAATQYLKNKTTGELMEKFKPIVQAAIDKVELTKSWKPIVTTYNRIPFVERQNPDLTDYVTKKGLEGLFTLVQDEELKIRKNPAAQVTDLLKKVFGSVMK
ncbi:MAG TPA: DUF4197 domain-containing protein [Bacteroidia bacterium]|jgi:hypothetical protein|nr:DUF4197 domain-containing protein [Bacteroidia bacterium]